MGTPWDKVCALDGGKMGGIAEEELARAPEICPNRFVKGKDIVNFVFAGITESTLDVFKVCLELTSPSSEDKVCGSREVAPRSVPLALSADVSGVECAEHFIEVDVVSGKQGPPCNLCKRGAPRLCLDET